ncbi:hypothetical protein [Paenibacillus sp. DMB20]|uniref:hypothetical protein n=1 Tax=Paenibacillus sp. DMB20 TaxID=1642570 RepID=UPI000627D2B9|nr:hypothetical protein [Paenibacillus sp. DMB20]KKO51104.1 hypothetical protein XI25_29390 [Paenibacillus sp. DMB20]
MKKLWGYIILGIALISIVGFIYYVFKGYFIMSVGDDGFYDGWGRKLYDPPGWMEMIWSGFQFPGYKWFIIDVVGFWIFAAVCGGLIKLSAHLRGVE